MIKERFDIIDAPKNELVGQSFKENYFDSFIRYLDAKPKTIQTYTRALRQFFKFLQKNNISNPKRADILAFRDELKERCKPTTVQSYIIAVRLFFKWLSVEGLYENVADKIKGATISTDHKKDYLTPKQIKGILKTIDKNTKHGKRDYTIFVLMVTGGLRTIEVSRANIEDLTTMGDNTILYLQGKGREERTEYIKIPEMTESIIREYLRERGTATGKDPLFISTSNTNKGGRISTRSISKIVKDILVNAGYNSDRLTAHSLRHTAVTLSLLGGNSLQDAQTFARHKNISTTQIYAHNIDKLKNKCSDTIAKAIF